MPLALSSKTIEEEHTKDTTLAIARANILSNNFSKLSVTTEYYPIRHPVSIANNIILFKNKIIIPASLQ